MDDELTDHLTDLLDYKLYNNKKGYATSFYSFTNTHFESVKDWILQQLMLYIVRLEFHIDHYKSKGLVLDYFPLHNYHERSAISQSFRDNWKKTAWYPFTIKSSKKRNKIALRPISLIGSYHGCEVGYYIMFHMLVAVF